MARAPDLQHAFNATLAVPAAGTADPDAPTISARIRQYDLRSLQGEKVRSFEECEIANFLFLNGIPYEYEAPYEHGTATPQRRQYKPDFHILEPSIYIEHFGIDMRGRTSPFVDKQQYLAERAWKRGLHAARGNEDAPDFTREEQDWDEAMHQALNLARAQGNAPGAITETVEAAHRSVVDWMTALRRYMTDTATRDYSWSVPNRRFIDFGLYLPSIRSEGMGAIAVIVDSSRSVDSDTLAVFWTHIRHVAAEIEPERVIVLQVDAELQDEQHYHPHELPLRIDVKGRYGTDFRPGFARLAEQGIRPAVCLYFTDMECNKYPETRPDFPVVWCNFGPPPSERNREPWGERIDIAPGRGARP